MKKLLLITFGLIIVSMSSFGQTANNYTFTAIQGNYVTIAGVAGVANTSLGATDDDVLSTAIPLPFAFTFAGTAYSSIRVSSNGWLSFATGAITDSNTNSSANAETRKPMLFPLWDNLRCTTTPKYITTGIAPHRRFKVEWSQQSWSNGAAGDVISFQVWLFESTNVVEFLYNQGAVAVNNNAGGASIGIYDATSKYLTLNNSGGAPTAQSDVFTTNIITKPATGQIYRFTPPASAGLEASNYCFSPSSRAYNTLTGTPVPTLGKSADDVISAAIPLDFPFNFGGVDYSNIRVSSNGWLTFGSQTGITAVQNYLNNKDNAHVIRPALMPLWDDLVCTEIPKYNVSGTAPNRIFKVEWSGQRWGYNAIGPVISFQIWLYEKSNVIEYIYDRDFWAVSNTAFATIGIYDANGKYLTLNNTTASPSASSTDFTLSINTKPAVGQVYRFTPPPLISYPGNAFIATGKVGVTQTGVTGGTYSASPSGLSLNSTTGEVDLSTSLGGTYTITYSVAGCTSATAEITIFPLLPQPIATIVQASCATGSDGSITITNMNNSVNFVKANNQYIDLGNQILSNRSAFTVEGWIKFSLANITGRTSLFGQNDVIEFGFVDATTIECYTATGGQTRASIPANLGNNQWHHIAATGDGTQVRIYVDGISLPVTNGNSNTSNYGASTFSAKIGSRVFNHVTGESFSGDILKVGFYSTALSASRIASLAFGPTTYTTSTPGLIAGYNFFDGAGLTLTSTPAGNNGTFQNSPVWNDPYEYDWKKVSDGSVVAPKAGDTKRNRTGLAAGDYIITVFLTGVSSPNAKIFTVGTAPDVVATAGTNANCTNTFTANWNASGTGGTYSIDVATDAAFTNFVGIYNNYDVGNVLTFNVLNVPPGPIFYRVRKNTVCGASASSNVISYQTLQIKSPVATAVTDLLCNGFTANWNAAVGANTYYLDVATDAAFTAMLPGYSNLNVGNVTSRVITGLASGATYFYRVRSASATCTTPGASSNTISILINIGPTAPVVGAVTQATCAKPTASVVLSGLPSGDWVLKFTDGRTYSGNGTSVTISDLTPGATYNVAVTSDVCFSANSANIVINPLNITTSTWNGTTWSNPTNINNYIVFAGDFISSGDISGCTCTVNSGVSVKVSSGDTFTITNAVTTSGGILTFENNASLVQTNDVSNTGNIIYKRTSKPMKNLDYTYWSSPIANQVITAVSPNTALDKHYSYDPAIANWKQETPLTRMIVGKGYIIRSPKAGTWGNGEVVVFPYSQPVQFVGVPNNGNVIGEEITSLTATRDFLIGNPYPSALNAQSFLSANTSILEGTIYLWTHNTVITQSGSKYIYSAGDYASFNGTGGTGTTSPALNPGNNAVPSGYIAAGQSFFAKAKNQGTIIFTNAMRVGGNNSQFFKPSKTGKENNIEKHRLWLDLSNDEGAYKQTLIGYIEGATNDYDDQFDGVSFDGNPFIDFYSINNNNKLVIQGRSLPFENVDTVPLGYKTTIAGNFTISINQVDGILDGQAIYLEDKISQITHDLRFSDYTFTTAIGTFDDRFVLKYKNSTLGSDDFDQEDNTVMVTVLNKEITISSAIDAIDKVFIYDVSGKQIYRKNNLILRKHT